MAARSPCIGAEMTTTARKGSRYYRYGMASWREGGKTRNVHLGSSRKRGAQTAMQKARAMKAEALAINPLASRS